MDAELQKDIRIIKDIRESSASAAKVSAMHKARCESLDRTIARLEALAAGDEPVDEAWLRSVGFGWQSENGQWMIYGCKSMPVYVSHDLRLWWFGFSPVPTPMNRQQVIALCAALGVKLRVETKEQTP